MPVFLTWSKALRISVKTVRDDSTLGAVATDDKTPDSYTYTAVQLFQERTCISFYGSCTQGYCRCAGSAYATDPDKAVYNGAYELTSWSHQDNMVMTARKTITTMITSRRQKSPGSFFLMKQRLFHPSRAAISFYSDSYPNEEITSLGITGFGSFRFQYNLHDVQLRRKGPAVLKDARVRKALSLVIDRDRIVKNRAADDDIATSYCLMGITDADGKDFHDTVTPWFDQSKYEDNWKTAAAFGCRLSGGANFPLLSILSIMLASDDC